MRIPDYVPARSLRCDGLVPDDYGDAKRCTLPAGHWGFHTLDRPISFEGWKRPTCAICGPRSDYEPLFAPQSKGEPKHWYCASHYPDEPGPRRWWQFWRST